MTNGQDWIQNEILTIFDSKALEEFNNLREKIEQETLMKYKKARIENKKFSNKIMRKIKRKIENYSHLEKSDKIVYASLISQCQKFMELNKEMMKNELSDSQKEKIKKNLSKLFTKMETLASEKEACDMNRPNHRIRYHHSQSANVFEKEESMKATEKENITSLTEKIQKKVNSIKTDIFGKTRKGKKEKEAARQARKRRDQVRNNRMNHVHQRNMVNHMMNEEIEEESSDEFARNRSNEEEYKEEGRRLRQDVFDINSGMNNQALDASINMNILSERNDLVSHQETIQKEVTQNLDDQAVSEQLEYDQNGGASHEINQIRTEQDSEEEQVNFGDYSADAAIEINHEIAAKRREVERLKAEAERLAAQRNELERQRRSEMEAIQRQITIMCALVNKMRREIQERKEAEKRFQKEMKKLSVLQQIEKAIDKFKKHNLELFKKKKFKDIKIMKINFSFDADQDKTPEVNAKEEKQTEEEYKKYFEDEEEKKKKSTGLLGFGLGFLGLAAAVATVVTCGLAAAPLIAAGCLTAVSCSLIATNYQLNKAGTYSVGNLFKEVAKDTICLFIPTIPKMFDMIKDAVVAVGEIIVETIEAVATVVVEVVKVAAEAICEVFQKIKKAIENYAIPFVSKVFKELGVVHGILNLINFENDYTAGCDWVGDLVKRQFEKEAQMGQALDEDYENVSDSVFGDYETSLKNNMFLQQRVFSLVYLEAQPATREIQEMVETIRKFYEAFEHPDDLDNKILQVKSENPRLRLDKSLASSILSDIMKKQIPVLQNFPQNEKLPSWNNDLQQKIVVGISSVLESSNFSQIYHPEVKTQAQADLLIKDIQASMDSTLHAVKEQLYAARLFTFVLQKDKQGLELAKNNILSRVNTRFAWINQVFTREIKGFFDSVYANFDSGPALLYRNKFETFVRDEVAQMKKHLQYMVYLSMRNG